MVRSGLVITFDGPASEASLRSVLVTLDAERELLACGEPQGFRLAAVITSNTSRAGADLLRKLEGVPCVRKVDVIAIDFGSDRDADEAWEESA